MQGDFECYYCGLELFAGTNFKFHNSLIWWVLIYQFCSLNF